MAVENRCPIEINDRDISEFLFSQHFNDASKRLPGVSWTDVDRLLGICLDGIYFTHSLRPIYISVRSYDVTVTMWVSSRGRIREPHSVIGCTSIARASERL
jgi:hypothetical protein